MSIIAGSYKLKGDVFTMGGAVFKVRERKASPNKFLIRWSPFEYISSLFALSQPDTYSFELGRKWWVLEFGEDCVHIREAKPAPSLASEGVAGGKYAEWLR